MKWIPISTKKPKDYQYVLFLAEFRNPKVSNRVHLGRQVGFFQKGEPYIDDKYFIRALAWSTIPSIPKKLIEQYKCK